MLLRRRHVLLAAIGSLAAPAVRADSFPNGPFRILVPFGPGSATDQGARNIADGLNRIFGVPVVVENKPGANGAIAADLAAKSKPDGQTIFVCSNTAAASNVALMKSLPYDPLKDFDPLTIIGRAPVFMMVNPQVEAATAGEFVALARRMPGKINFGSGSASTRISGELLKAKAGIDMVHVPYKGEGPALIDIIAGRVDIFIGNISAALRFQKAKQVKFLGLAAKSRSLVAPEVPDAAEIGLPNLIASAWFGIVAPPGTPDAIVQKINTDTAAALKLSDVRAKFLEQGAEPQGASTASTSAFIKEEEARWRAVIKSANVTLE